MSGFFGILREDGREVDRQLLQRVAAALRFRGGDRETIWQRPGAGTCFAYLETGPGRQAAQQPVLYGDSWIIGDVRLDARDQLLDQLRSAENSVSSEPTQEELLQRAWQAWGESSLQKILGDFSFALWDQSLRSLFCARDFIGARPFYYVHTGGVFCFSNSIDTLRLVPQVSSDLDEIFIGDFLLRGYCSDLSRTAFADIHRLPSGHLLKYCEQAVSIRRFLTLPVEEPLRFSRQEEYLEAYRHVLQEAVQDRLPRGPAALYLSGGLDSSSVCAMASKLSGRSNECNKLKAFTVSWQSLFEDPEPEFATISAKFLGLSHQILEEPAFEPFAKSDNRADRTPELSSESTFAVAQKNYREIAAHSRVILSGDGGDDVLIGQSWPYFVHLWTSGERLEIARSLGRFIWKHGSIPPLRVGIKSKLRRLLGRGDPLEGYPAWLNPEFANRCGLRNRWLQKQSLPDRVHPLHPDAYAALHGGYWSAILESEDAGNTRVALETRAPLLDLRLLRFLLKVPPVPWCVNKELVRRSLQGYLPEAVLNRPKTALRNDPLLATLASGRWAPQVPDRPSAGAERFIDWAKWKSTLKYSKDSTSVQVLLPFALVEWLKDVENMNRIQ